MASRGRNCNPQRLATFNARRLLDLVAFSLRSHLPRLHLVLAEVVIQYFQSLLANTQTGGAEEAAERLPGGVQCTTRPP